MKLIYSRGHIVQLPARRSIEVLWCNKMWTTINSMISHFGLEINRLTVILCIFQLI